MNQRLRFEILKRDRFTCRYCGAAAPDVQLHVDHVRPVADGGGDEPGNLVAACDQCNLGKAGIPLTRPDTDFRRAHQEPVRQAPTDADGPPIIVPIADLYAFGEIPRPVSRHTARILLALRRSRGLTESYGALAKEWGWSRNKARGFLQRVRFEGLLVEVVE